jgi:hypothetical protein
MNNKPDFSFDRTLASEELNFWSTFFDYFPCHHNRCLQSLVSYFAKEIKGTNDIEDYYEHIKTFETKEELINFMNGQDLPEAVKENYPRVIKDLDKIFPDSNPVDLFLMSIYGAYIQGWELELNQNGINLVPGGRSVDLTTYVPQLAMVVDLMNERAAQIFPHLNLKPIKVSGEKVLIDEKDGNKTFKIKIEKNSLITRMVINKRDDSFSHDFSVTFNENGDISKEIYSPLQQEQKKFITVINKHFLENELTSKETKQKTRKI